MTKVFDPTTETLKLSIAIELLASRMDTELEMYHQNKDLFSYEDLVEMARVCRFITENSKHDYTSYAIKLEEHIDKLDSK